MDSATAPLAQLDPAGSAASEILDLTIWLTVLGTVVYLAVMAVLAWALVRRRNDPEPDAIPATEPVEATGRRTLLDLPRGSGRWLIVGGGVVLPAVVIVVVFGLTLASMVRLDRDVGDDALVVEVTGQQWQWHVAYPNGVSDVDQLRIPAGEPVVIDLGSDDVIHSFWVPELAGKLDALPDHRNTLVIEADAPGTYNGHCAEFCGLEHASMRFEVIAMEPAEFDAWLASSGEDADGADDAGASEDGAHDAGENDAAESAEGANE